MTTITGNIVKEHIMKKAQERLQKEQKNKEAGANPPKQTSETIGKSIAQKNQNQIKKELIETLLNDIEKVDLNELCKKYGWVPEYDRDGNEKKPLQKHIKVAIIKYLINISKQKDWKLAKDGDYIYIYNGAYWIPFVKDDIIYLLEQFAIKAGVSMIEAAEEQFLEKLYRQLQKESYFNSKTHSNKNLINLQNGTFDIASLQLRSFDYRNFLTYQLPYPYKEGAINPLWHKFLDEVIPDKETQRTLQEVLGSIFIKDIKLEYIFFLYGSGQNGKSVVMEVVSTLLGKENISNFSLEQLMEEHNRAMIKDKLLNFGSETNMKKIDVDTFKALASNEPVQARLKYGNSFMMEDYAKLIFNVNKFQFSDIEYTKGFFRRFLIIPFDVTIPDEKVDRRLHHKIIATGMEGILNWIIQGAKRVIENEDIYISNKCEIAKEQFLKEIDNVRLFLDDNSYQPSKYNRIKAAALYGEYRNYCMQNNFRSVSSKTFKERLHSFGIEWKRERDTSYYLIEKI